MDEKTTSLKKHRFSGNPLHGIKKGLRCLNPLKRLLSNKQSWGKHGIDPGRLPPKDQQDHHPGRRETGELG